MPAMGGGDPVGRPQGRTYAYRGRLFADRNVEEAGDFPGGDQVLDFLLEVPDALHLLIHFEDQILADVHELRASLFPPSDAKRGTPLALRFPVRMA